MTMKRDAKRTTRKKLTLNKETVRDLTPGTKHTDAVRGGIGDVNPSGGNVARYSCRGC